MNELIPISSGLIGGEAAQTVAARELHAFLGSRAQFADWIRSRINQYDFEEGRDFVTFSENSEKGRPTIEYALSLDMAKELSMVERTPKGKEARAYFIECERRARAALSIPAQIPASPPPLSLPIREAARGLGVEPHELAASLEARGRPDWERELAGLLGHRITTTHLADGSVKTVEQVRVTPRALHALARWSATVMIGNIASHIADNQYEADVNIVERKVEAVGERGILRGRLKDQLRSIRKRDFMESLEALEDGGRIVLRPVIGSCKPGVVIIHTKFIEE